jgi:adenosylhomocysteine nucleosidase
MPESPSLSQHPQNESASKQDVDPLDAPVPSCDVLIFTAVPEEVKALKQAANDSCLNYEKIERRNFEYRNLGRVGGNRVMAVETQMGPFGFDGSAARAIYAKAQTQATTLISLGMDRARQQIGDILISTSVLTYDDRHIKRDENGTMATHYPDRIRYGAREQILNPLRQEADRRKWSGVQFGSLLSGGCAIHCAEFRDNLVRQLTQELRRLSPRPDEVIIGGEMEACGILATSERDDPSWVVVKGISDYADERRDDEIKETRPIACRNAARFLLDALRNFQPGEDVEPSVNP